MIKNNVKKIMVSLIAILLVITVAYTTYATSGDSSILDEINEMLQEENGNVDKESGTLEEIPEGTDPNANLQTETKPTVVNENRPETTPYTGVEDYTGLIFVVIFAASAIYAYKKVRDYKA